MGCGTTCLKCLIIGINIVFGLIGAVLFGVGLFVRFGLADTLNDLMGDTLEGIPGIPDLFNFVDSQADSLASNLNVDFGELLQPVATVLIVIGVVLLVIAVCGACGACCNSRCLMIVYCILVAVILAAQIILVVLFFTNTLDPAIKKHLNATIVNDYVGIDDYGIYSLSWNLVMTYFECCGIEGYEDFQYAKNWQSSRIQEVSGFNITVNLTTPAACCKFDGSWPSVNVIDEMCSITPNSTNSNYDIGCYGAVSGRLSESETLALGILGGILAIQLLILVGGIIIAHSQRANKTDIV